MKSYMLQRAMYSTQLVEYVCKGGIEIMLGGPAIVAVSPYAVLPLPFKRSSILVTADNILYILSCCTVTAIKDVKHSCYS